MASLGIQKHLFRVVQFHSSLSPYAGSGAASLYFSTLRVAMGQILSREAGLQPAAHGQHEPPPGEVAIPMDALFRVTVAIGVVDVEKAIALLIAVRPGHAIHQRPDEVATHVHAIFHGIEHRRDVLADVIDAVIVFYRTFFQRLAAAQPVLRNIDGLVGVIAMDTHEHIVEPLRENGPIPVRRRHVCLLQAAADAAQCIGRRAALAAAVVVHDAFAMPGRTEVTRVIIDAEKIQLTSRPLQRLPLICGQAAGQGLALQDLQ